MMGSGITLGHAGQGFERGADGAVCGWQNRERDRLRTAVTEPFRGA
jgi:hypothetical protein